MTSQLVKLFPAPEDLPLGAKRALQRGFELRNEGDMKGAVACFRAVSSVEPRLYVAVLMTAFAEMESGNLVEAASMLQRCVRMKPRHALASLILFHSLADLGRVDEPFAEVRRLLRLRESPDHRALLTELSEGIRDRPADAYRAKVQALVDECARIPIRPTRHHPRRPPRKRPLRADGDRMRQRAPMPKSTHRRIDFADDQWRRAERLLDAGQTREGFRLMLSAAKSGYVSAENSIGYLFDIGRGTRRSGTKALFWFLRAARKNDMCAVHNVGVVYRDRGEARRALSWFRKAVRLGNDGSLLEIAKLWAGPLKDPVRALWAVHRLLESHRLLSEDEKEEAIELRESLRRLSSWRSTPAKGEELARSRTE